MTNLNATEAFPTRDLFISKGGHGQTELRCSRGLVATMEAGSQPTRDTDAAAIVAAVALGREAEGIAHERDVARAACVTLTAGRDAALARVAELEADNAAMRAAGSIQPSWWAAACARSAPTPAWGTQGGDK